MDFVVDTRQNNRITGSRGSTHRKRASHNSAGHTPGIPINTPAAPASNMCDGIFSDDERRNCSSGSRGRNHNQQNDSSDNSRFSGDGDSTTAQFDTPGGKDPKQVRKQRKEEEKRQNAMDKLAESQRRKDAETECINLTDDDKHESPHARSFDGVRIDKAVNKFGDNNDEKIANRVENRSKGYREEASRSQGRNSKSRGKNHGQSALADGRITHKQRNQRREEQRERVLPSYSGDPLDQATSEMEANTGRGSSYNNLEAPPKLKSDIGGNKTVKTQRQKTNIWGKASMSTKRDKAAEAAVKRIKQNDHTQGQSSSGEKRKRHGDKSSRKGSKHGAINVDADEADEITNTIEACGQKFYQGGASEKKSSSLSSAALQGMQSMGIQRCEDGRTGEGKSASLLFYLLTHDPSTLITYSSLFLFYISQISQEKEEDRSAWHPLTLEQEI